MARAAAFRLLSENFMKLSYAVPTPLEYFAALVQSDAEFPLLEAAVSLAAVDQGRAPADPVRLAPGGRAVADG